LPSLAEEKAALVTPWFQGGGGGGAAAKKDFKRRGERVSRKASQSPMLSTITHVREVLLMMMIAFDNSSGRPK
jgi:hypothetical protein